MSIKRDDTLDAVRYAMCPPKNKVSIPKVTPRPLQVMYDRLKLRKFTSVTLTFNEIIFYADVYGLNMSDITVTVSSLDEHNEYLIGLSNMPVKVYVQAMLTTTSGDSYFIFTTYESQATHFPASTGVLIAGILRERYQLEVFSVSLLPF